MAQAPPTPGSTDTTNGYVGPTRGVLLELDRDLEGFLTDVDRRLRPYLAKALSHIPRVEPLRRGVAYQIMSGGKRIRAALCVASCELFGSTYLRAFDYAAAIEHMQNFTLIHDDIADGDEERRSQPSIWQRFGLGHGINIGDAFVPLVAFAILRSPYTNRLKLELLETVTKFGLEMTEGQALDINMRTRDDVTVDDYLTCTKKKTGAFLAMATVGGGLIGGATPDEINTLTAFAEAGGAAFQIKDDVLDLDGTKGRAVGSDILEGKRTLLVIQAARNASSQDRRRLFEILDKPRHLNTSEEVAWVVELYRATRAREYALLMAVRMVDEACSHLMSLPPSPARSRLLHLSRYLSRRAR